MIDDAIAAGAELRELTPVVDWKADAGSITVRTASGDVRAARLVITAGPWSRQLLAAAGAMLTVMRQVVCWFNLAERAAFEVPHFPVFMADLPDGCFYGIPATDGRGLKIARHYGAPELTGPEAIERTITDRDETPIREFMDQHIPTANGPRQEASVCLYTLTPDRHFVIDRHPEHQIVSVACGFSGHGFKFAPVVGALLADLADGQSKQGPELFRFARFGRGQRVEAM
jgi:sarcosine oxidase